MKLRPMWCMMQLCVQGDEEAMKKMLKDSRNVLPHCVDSNERR